MNGKRINFDNKNIKKSDFYNKNKKIFNTDDTDVNKVLVSKKEQYGKYNSFKYFTGYNDNDVVRPLYLFISQTTGYINKFEKNKIAVSLMIKDIQLLKNYNKVRKNIEKSMKIDFNTKTTYGDDDKYIKTRIKIYKESTTKIFLIKMDLRKYQKKKYHINVYQ